MFTGVRTFIDDETGADGIHVKMMLGGAGWMFVEKPLKAQK